MIIGIKKKNPKQIGENNITILSFGVFKSDGQAIAIDDRGTMYCFKLFHWPVNSMLHISYIIMCQVVCNTLSNRLDNILENELQEKTERSHGGGHKLDIKEKVLFCVGELLFSDKMMIVK